MSGIERFGSNVPNYTGPQDGLSHPRARGLLKKINYALLRGKYRVEMSGEENFPQTGRQVYCPTHQSTLDPLIIFDLAKRDIRYLANIFLFQNRLGKLLSIGGAFPVDREHPHIRTLRHCLNILRDEKGLCVFPEGKFPHEEKNGQVGGFMKGAAFAAIEGDAENVVPVAIHVEKDKDPRVAEKRLHNLISLGAGTAGVVAGAIGGIPAQIALLTGSALSAAWAGRQKVSRMRMESDKEWYNPAPRYLATIAGAAVGGAIGLAAGIVLSLLPPVAAVVAPVAGAAGGLALSRFLKSWRHRDVAKVEVQKPIPVEEFRAMGPKEGALRLTEKLHTILGKAKEKLGGVPYDERAEKALGKFVPSCE